MGRRHFKPEQIIHMLREAEIKKREDRTKILELMAYMRVDLARLGLELAVLTGLGGIGFLLVPSKSR